MSKPLIRNLDPSQFGQWGATVPGNPLVADINPNFPGPVLSQCGTVTGSWNSEPFDTSTCEYVNFQLSQLSTGSNGYGAMTGSLTIQGTNDIGFDANYQQNGLNSLLATGTLGQAQGGLNNWTTITTSAAFSGTTSLNVSLTPEQVCWRAVRVQFVTSSSGAVSGSRGQQVLGVMRKGLAPLAT